MNKISQASISVNTKKQTIFTTNISNSSSTVQSKVENLTNSSKLIEANDDVEALSIWLKRYEHSPNTFRSYKKEIERFIFWLSQCKNKSFNFVKVDDIEDYFNFIQNIDQNQEWIGLKVKKNTEEWRPFEKKLSLTSLHQVYLVLNSAFNFLVKSGYFTANPCLLVNKSRFNALPKKAKIERYLSKELWLYVLKFINDLPQSTPKEIAYYERANFVFRFLYLLSPRLSEVAQTKMNDFIKIRNKWWWNVVGKGNKVAQIPVNNQMLDVLIHYREFLGLEAFPSRDDNSALIRNLNNTAGLGQDMIYRMVKKIFKDSAIQLKQSDSYSASILEKASTHWLRHTSLTHQADMQIDIRYIQANARHSSIETTQKYLHIEDDKWHKMNQNILMD